MSAMVLLLAAVFLASVAVALWSRKRDRLRGENLDRVGAVLNLRRKRGRWFAESDKRFRRRIMSALGVVPPGVR